MIANYHTILTKHRLRDALKLTAKRRDLSETQKVLLLERRTALYRAILGWAASQPVYMPAVAAGRRTGDYSFIDPSDNPKAKPIIWADSMNDTLESENMELFLPSDIPAEHRRRVCKARIDQIERRHRLAALEDTLGAVHKNLRVWALLRSQYKGKLVGSVKTDTQARTELDGWLKQSKKEAASYRASRLALLALDPDGDWQKVYRELKEADLRGPYVRDVPGDLSSHPSHKDRDWKTGSGHTETPWIWLVKVRGDDAEDYMRVQWSNLMANANRFAEEQKHGPEEMRRVLQYYEWEIQEWRTRAYAWDTPSGSLLGRALKAYTEQQI
jgi:hypothetical protein